MSYWYNENNMYVLSESVNDFVWNSNKKRNFSEGIFFYEIFQFYYFFYAVTLLERTYFTVTRVYMSKKYTKRCTYKPTKY